MNEKQVHPAFANANHLGFGLSLSNTDSAACLRTGERCYIRILDKAWLLSLLNLSVCLMLLAVTSFLNIACNSWRVLFFDFIPVYPALLPVTGSKRSKQILPQCHISVRHQNHVSSAACTPLQAAKIAFASHPLCSLEESRLQNQPGAEMQGRLYLATLSSSLKSQKRILASICMSQGMYKAQAASSSFLEKKNNNNIAQPTLS